MFTLPCFYPHSQFLGGGLGGSFVAKASPPNVLFIFLYRGFLGEEKIVVFSLKNLYKISLHKLFRKKAGYFH